jgi:hypothetical protein
MSVFARRNAALTRVNPEVTRISLPFVFNFKTEEEEESCSAIMTCEMQDEAN